MKTAIEMVGWYGVASLVWALAGCAWCAWCVIRRKKSSAQKRAEAKYWKFCF